MSTPTKIALGITLAASLARQRSDTLVLAPMLDQLCEPLRSFSRR